ncbi:MAG: DEAD/DEAH box helicase [Candidatus Woesearchaeota archaeon]
MIKDFTPRLYQETILASCVQNNCLVVLPTGMGKTAVAFLLAAQRLNHYPNSKILVLAPTKPLVEQHLNSFIKHLDISEDKFELFTGAISPEKREKLWKNSQVIFSTPQTIENDIISGKADLSDVSLIVFDEAHRATGDYSYTFIAKQYNKKASYPKILALTASPGSDKERIDEVIKNLYVEAIEVRTEDDPDVKPYIQKVDLEWVKVDLPEKFLQIKKYLEACYKSKLDGIKEIGFLNSSQVNSITKRELLGVMSELHKEIASGNKEFSILKGVSLAAEAMKAQHALELLETQGIWALNAYFEKLMRESRTTKVRAVKNLVMDLNFRSAFILTKNMNDDKIEHPKLSKLIELVKRELGDEDSKQTTISGDVIDNKKKMIIFTQYRDSGSRIVETVNNIKNVDARLFVGQTKKGETGLSQKKQIELLDSFRKTEFNVIVMTSVGEEGLDIPQVDVVVFYEPIPSAIRTVQRRGRTGRLEKGKVIILYAKSTRDEAYMWIAQRKEKRMYKIIDEIRRDKGFDSIGVVSKDISDLSKHMEDERYSQSSQEKEARQVVILADAREKGSAVIKELVDKGAKLELKRIDVGDYVLSERVAVEFKNVPDFVDSIIDGRLLQQVKFMKEKYSRPIIIVEGTENMYAVRRIHPNAIWGMISTIAVSFGVPIINTRTSKETAGLIFLIARREQENVQKPLQLHAIKPLSIKEQQEYIVASFPGIGSTLNKPLLEKLGSIKNIVNASEEELKKVEKIGDKKAKEIRTVLDSEYKGE